MIIPCAFSPCPNDTFLFHALLEGLIDSDITLIPELADIEELNRWAEQRRHPLMKVSFACLPSLLRHYQVLPVGAAIGYGCGPKLVAREAVATCQLETMRIAIPGEHTSAHLLFKALVPPAKELVFCRYDEVTSKIKSGEVDAGVIIHETRFCFADSGLVELCDLGALWEYRYQCPVPLGCLVASRDLDVRTVEKLITALQSSLQYAWDHPAASEVFVATHAQELSSEVIRKHIELYVSDETMQLSADAQKGIATFLQLADPSLEQTSYASDWLFVTEAGLPS